MRDERSVRKVVAPCSNESLPLQSSVRRGGTWDDVVQFLHAPAAAVLKAGRLTDCWVV